MNEEEISDGDNGKDVEEVRVSVISSSPRAKEKRSPKETPLSSRKGSEFIYNLCSLQKFPYSPRRDWGFAHSVA